MIKEICICAAIKDDTGYIWHGHRHVHCLDAIEDAGKIYTSYIQGFVTSENRFVNRYEGYELQIKAEIKSFAKDGYRGKRLFSEDLY